MFITSFSLRHLLNDVIIQRLNRQLLIRYQSQFNLKEYQSNENEQDLGLFKNFDINEQTQERLKGFSFLNK